MDLSQEKQLQEKQDFLSKEILEQGFDPEDFQDYMLSESDKDLDLREWSIQELKDVVEKYKKPKSEQPSQQQAISIQQVKKQEKSEEKPKEKESSKTQIIKQQSKKKKIDRMQEQSGKSHKKSIHVDFQHYQIKKKINVSELYVISCLQKKNISIKINKYTKTNADDLFKASYIQYHIETSEGWKVQRRYNDFIWLRQYLNQFYMGIPVPPIPQKTAVRSFDEKHIEFRMKALEKCLNQMLLIPQICSDQTFEIFLRADKEYFSQIKRKKQKEQNNQNKPLILQSIFGDDLLIHGKQGVSERRQTQYDELGFKYQLLCSQISNLQQTLKKASSQSYLISSTFQEINSRLKSPKGIGIFSVMYTYFNQLGMHLSKTTEQFKDNIFKVWSYQTSNILNLNESISKLAKEHNNIHNKQKNLIPHLGEGKPKSQSGDNPKWSKQFKQLQISKEKYKIKLSYLLRGLKYYEKNNFRMIAEEWTKSLKVYIGEVSQWMIDCTDQLTRSMSLAEGKQLMQVEYLKT